MDHSSLVRLQQQATQTLPSPMARELSRQIAEMQYRGELTRGAVSANRENLSHVAAEVQQGFAAITAALDDAPPGTDAHEGELLAQVDLVLTNNRQLLEEAHQANLAQVRQAKAGSGQLQPSALDDFLEGATFGLFKR